MVQRFPLFPSHAGGAGTGAAGRAGSVLIRRRGWPGLLAALALLPAPLAGDSLRVATYNLANYGPADRITGAGFRPAYPKPEAEKSALRRVLHELDADLLALQESGSPAHLEELRRDLAREGLHYPHRASAEGSDERRCAVLSRRPLRAVRTHQRALTFEHLGTRVTPRRGILEVVVELGMRELPVFIVHLKSRLTEDPRDPGSAQRRQGEAGALRDLLRERFPDPSGVPFLVLGDFNDGPTTRTVQTLRRRGRSTSLLLLPAADDRGDTWTHLFRREETYTRVDLMLVSPGAERLVPEGRARVLDLPEVRTAGDHRPVVVTLRAPLPVPRAGGLSAGSPTPAP